MARYAKFILKTKEVTGKTPDWGLGQGVFVTQTATLSDDDLHAGIQITRHCEQMVDDFIMVQVVEITEEEYNKDSDFKIEDILYDDAQREKLDKLRNELKTEQEKKRRNQLSAKEAKEWKARYNQKGNRKDYTGVVVRDEFKKMTTKHLLGLRDFYYYDNYWDNHVEGGAYEKWASEQLEIRAELSTREHVPSKKESKVLRRELAKKNKGGRRSHKK